jgi:Zn-dependent peptidase ImmA (M78 family)
LTVAIRAAVRGGDATSLRLSAHTLKGALRYFGEGAAFDLACRLEKSGLEGRTAEADTLLGSLDAEAARELRKIWALKSGPISHLAALVEDAGCIIVDYTFPSLKLDGLCLRAPGKPPIIFLNKGLPKSRRRLSLAHELGHVIMHVDPHERVEDEAWDFASEFMMPSAEIEKELNDLNLDRLGQLKKKWGLSMQAILYWARKLEIISESQSRFLWMQIGKCGYRRDEPFEDAIPEENPTEMENRLKTST